MKAFLRSAVLAVGVASTLAVGTSPAAADDGAVAFHGVATLTNFGGGTVPNQTATLWVIGEVHGNHVDGPATATFTVVEPPGTCPVTGTAFGDVNGTAENGTPIVVGFDWTRVGAVAVITTTKDIAGGVGVAAFAVTSPVGNPCPGPVKAKFAGAVAG